jgi:hypothetical protein
MASIPLAIVLVAALVVPLAVIPGTFGFESWPSARSEQVTERPVRDLPTRIAVAKARPAGSAHAAARRPATTGATPAAERRPIVAVVPSPGPAPGRDASGRDGSGAGPGEPREPAAPAPSTPASAPDQPSTDSTPEPAVEDVAPVLRDDAPAVPPAPPAPADPAVPVAPNPPLPE